MLVSKSTYIALIKYYINLGDYLNKTTYGCSFIQVILLIILCINIKLCVVCYFKYLLICQRKFSCNKILFQIPPFLNIQSTCQNIYIIPTSRSWLLRLAQFDWQVKQNKRSLSRQFIPSIQTMPRGLLKSRQHFTFHRSP